MANSTVADFHQGWMVEVVHEGTEFRSICYSPSRQRLSDYRTYTDQSRAMAAAKQLIDRQMVGHALQCVMRELFEQGALSFDDWRSLHNSLVFSVRDI